MGWQIVWQYISMWDDIEASLLTYSQINNETIQLEVAMGNKMLSSYSIIIRALSPAPQAQAPKAQLYSILFLRSKNYLYSFGETGR